MTRTHDKNDEDCKECIQAYMPPEERSCEFYKGESPQVWVVKREAGAKTLWVRREIPRTGEVTWTEDFAQGTGFGDFEEATEIAENAATETGETVQVVPMTWTLLKEARDKAIAEGETEETEKEEAGKPDIDIQVNITAMKIPFPGALMMEMDPTKPGQSVSDLVGLLGSVFGDFEPKPTPKDEDPYIDLLKRSGPLGALVAKHMPDHFHQWAKDKAEVRAEVKARMDKLLDEIDVLGTMAMHASDSKLSLHLVSIRRAICNAVHGVDFVKPRIDIQELTARLKKEAREKVKPKTPEAPAAAPVAPVAPETPVAPVERLKRKFRVTYKRPAGHGSSAVGHDVSATGGRGGERRDYGIIEAVDPADAVQAVVDMTHPYLPVSPDNERTNAVIASQRSEMRAYLKAVAED